jgi:hypothetical protein
MIDTTLHASIQATASNTLELKDSNDGTGSAVELKNLAPPLAGTSAVNRNYIDGLSIKEAVYAATTATLILAAAPSGNTIVLANGEGGFDSDTDALTLDGVSVSTGSRILVRNNVGTSESLSAVYQGIFTVGALNGATCTLTRAEDMNVTSEAKLGSSVLVTKGTTYGGKTFYVSTAPATLNTNIIEWTQVSSGSSGFDTAGDGLTFVGTTVNVAGTENRISVTSDAVDIASTYVGQTSITTLGTVATGTWQGTEIADAYVAADLTIEGGTINDTAIGATTANSGAFTTVNASSTLDVTGASTFTGLITANGHLKMGSSQHIKDSGDNKVLDFGATGSAVNHVKVTNAATGGRPVISAIGDDTDVGLELLVQGSGTVAIKTTTTDTGTVVINPAGKGAGQTCTLAFTAGADHTLTFPAGTDTLVGRATTDTLTNKTIDTATITGGTLNNCVIGGSTAAAGSFTTISATGTISAVGANANVELRLAGKGTGRVSCLSSLLVPEDGFIGTSGSVNLIKLDGSTTTVTVTGALTVTGTLTQASDLRYKRNVRDCGGLDVVDQLRGVKWEWRKDLMSKQVDELDDAEPEQEEGEEEDENKEDEVDNTSAGVVAQELQDVMPYAVQTGEDGKLSVNYSALHGVEINALKELSARVRALEAQVLELTKGKNKKHAPVAPAQYNLRPRSGK